MARYYFQVTIIFNNSSQFIKRSLSYDTISSIISRNFKYETKGASLYSSVVPHNDPEKLKPLYIDNIETVPKTWSFIKHLFVGKYDRDFLKFPSLFKTKEEILFIQNQYKFARSNFLNILKNEKALNDLGFNSLWKMTTTEMVNILEGIGSSLTNGISFVQDENCKGESNQPSQKNSINKDVIYSLIKLLIHNCLSYSTLEECNNSSLKEKLVKSTPKIGFAWCEKHLPLGSGYFTDWFSKAELSQDKNNWIISGMKQYIFDDNYDEYLIFCRTKDFIETHKENYYYLSPSIVGVLVPKNMVSCSTQEIDDMKFQTIKFEKLSLSRSKHELIGPSFFGISPLNVRGKAYLGSSACILGCLKSVLDLVYSHLNNSKITSCLNEKNQLALTDITMKIYSVESVLYMTSQIYDSFDATLGREIYLEASACKVLAIEYSRDIFIQLKLLLGSQGFILSQFHDLINIFDSFMENTLHHRILIAAISTHFYGHYNDVMIYKERMAYYYPLEYFIRLLEILNKLSNKPKLTLFFKNFISKTLELEANKLETCVHKFDVEIEKCLKNYGKEMPKMQNYLEILTQMALDIFEMSCVLARGSRAIEICEESKVDLEIVRRIINEKQSSFFHLIDHLNDKEPKHYRNREVHEKNIEFGGYFSLSPMDKFYY